MLRPELQEEVDFVQKNIDKGVKFEIPHPSDIFTKFKLLASCPIDSFGVDYLVILHVFSKYFEISKEKMMQISGKFEKLITK